MRRKNRLSKKKYKFSFRFLSALYFENAMITPAVLRTVATWNGNWKIYLWEWRWGERWRGSGRPGAWVGSAGMPQVVKETSEGKSAARWHWIYISSRHWSCERVWLFDWFPWWCGDAGLSIGLQFHQSRCCVWFQRSVRLMLVVISPFH